MVSLSVLVLKISTEQLHDEYMAGASMSELGKRHGMTRQAICERFKNADLPRRSYREANLLARRQERLRKPPKPRKLCAICDEPMHLGAKRPICPVCQESIWHARRLEIVQLWREGHEIATIAEMYQTTPGVIATRLHRLRGEGYDLPKRRA